MKHETNVISYIVVLAEMESEIYFNEGNKK